MEEFETTQRIGSAILDELTWRSGFHLFWDECDNLDRRQITEALGEAAISAVRKYVTP